MSSRLSRSRSSADSGASSSSWTLATRLSSRSSCAAPAGVIVTTLRLPFTWPASLGQGVANQPATHPERTSNGVDANGKYCTTPGSPFGGPQCTTTYTEGIFVGYRWYDQQHLTPLYPFGYGLSYTRFAYSACTGHPPGTAASTWRSG